MKILFRTDSSINIGAGHVSRCIVLAKKMRELGAECTFVCRDFTGHLGREITALGFELILLKAVFIYPSDETVPNQNNQYAEWLGVSESVDLAQTQAAISGRYFDWCIIDHYAIGKNWETAIRKTCQSVMVIDDLCDRLHDCDLLLNQNFGKSHQHRYRKLIGFQADLLLGPRYALLRECFASARSNVSRSFHDNRSIFICMGGMDNGNFTADVIDTIKNSGLLGVNVDVVIGRQNPNSNAVKILCRQLNFNFHIQPLNFVHLMSTATLSIGSSGVMSWERCCLGLPSVTIAVARNQVQIGQELAAAGATIFVGRSWDGVLSTLNDVVVDLLNQPVLLETMSANAYKLVDGLGVDRVARAISK